MQNSIEEVADEDSPGAEEEPEGAVAVVAAAAVAALVVVLGHDVDGDNVTESTIIILRRRIGESNNNFNVT